MNKRTARIATVAFLWGALVSTLLFGGCEAVDGAYTDCAPGSVQQVDLCPNTGGKLAHCTGWSEEDQVHVRVSWCSIEATPPEGGTDLFLCVPECPL